MQVIGVGDNVFDVYENLGIAYPGGNAVNCAVSAARLGAEASYCGALADDSWGEVMRASLRSESVDLSLCRTIKGGTTKLVRQERHKGERFFLGVDEGDAWVPFPKLDAGTLARLRKADVLLSSCNGKVESQLGLLDGHEGILYFDFGEKEKYRTEEYFGKVLPHIDLAQFSMSETDDLEVREFLDAWHFVEQGIAVLVTRGTAAPLFFFQDKEVRGVPAEGQIATDTMGAGDAFVAALALCLSRRGWRHGWTPGTAAKIEADLAEAGRHAARMCQRDGGFGHPYRWKRTVRAVIFDLDGVLVESEPYYVQQLINLAACHGKAFSQEQIDSIYGSSDEHQLNLLCEVTGESRDAVECEYNKCLYESPIDYSKVAIAGAEELLSYLQGNGVHIAVASSSHLADIRRALDQTGLARHVDAVASGFDECHASKPDPAVYRLALERLGVSPDEALIVEDSTYGIQAGVAAGVDVLCLVKPHGNVNRTGAVLEFDSYEQILGYLDAVLHPSDRTL
jgi:HAD superfamily hydrolase (TIGR01509 family)